MANIQLEASGYLGDEAGRSPTEFADEIDQVADLLRDAWGTGQGGLYTVTISGGVATPTTQPQLINLIPEGGSGSASDDLDNLTVTNYAEGSIVTIRMNDASDTITIKNNSGGGAGRLFMKNNSDRVLETLYDAVTFIRLGSFWYELSTHGKGDVFRDVNNLASVYLDYTTTAQQDMAGALKITDYASVEAKNGTTVCRFDLREYNGGAQRLRARQKWDESNEFYQVDAFDSSATVTAFLRINPVNKWIGIGDDTTGIGLRFHATRPSSLTNGDVWFESGSIRCYTGGAEKNFNSI